MAVELWIRKTCRGNVGSWGIQPPFLSRGHFTEKLTGMYPYISSTSFHLNISIFIPAFFWNWSVRKRCPIFSPDKPPCLLFDLLPSCLFQTGPHSLFHTLHIIHLSSSLLGSFTRQISSSLPFPKSNKQFPFLLWMFFSSTTIHLSEVSLHCHLLIFQVLLSFRLSFLGDPHSAKTAISSPPIIFLIAQINDLLSFYLSSPTPCWLQWPYWGAISQEYFLSYQCLIFRNISLGDFWCSLNPLCFLLYRS